MVMWTTIRDAKTGGVFRPLTIRQTMFTIASLPTFTPAGPREISWQRRMRVWCSRRRVVFAPKFEETSI